MTKNIPTGDILFPPVLDGSEHEMYFDNNDGVEITGFNVWYWLDEKEIDNEHNDMETEEERNNTKAIIKYIKEVQKILDKNNIKYQILSD